MRIGVNLRPLRPGIMGGMEHYFRRVMERLVQADHEFIFFVAPWNQEAVDFPYPNCRKVLVPEEYVPSLWNRIRAKWSSWLAPKSGVSSWWAHPASGYRLDLWFCPFINLEPRPLPIPSVVTIPDLLHEEYPSFLEAGELAHRQRNYRPTCEMASLIITISEFSRSQLIQTYQLSPEKVRVVYLSADLKESVPEERLAAVRRKYSLPDRYLYYPANNWPHKNHDLLLIALGLLRREGYPVPMLVFSGADVGSSQRQLRLAELLNVPVRHLGYLPAEDVTAVYRGAAAMVFPSLFEGFGMPLLEAMAAGVPIAASATTSIPEIAGEAALYFDPRSARDMARTLRQLLEDESLRNRLVETGLKRRLSFSWEAAAQATLAAFHGAGRQGPGSQRRVSSAGLMPDGWMGESLEISPAGVTPRRLIIEGESPMPRPDFYPQELVLQVGHKKFPVKRLVGPGEFRLDWDLPGTPAGTMLLKPGRTFSPRQEGWSDDGRRLSVRLRRAVLECREGEADLLSGRFLIPLSPPSLGTPENNPR